MLYRSDVDELGIKGFSPEDSARMVERYIHSWAKDRLLLDMAESHLSKSDRDVEAQLEEYRRQLLVYRYEQQYVEQRLDTAISLQEYREYYDSHQDNFIARVPLMKGIYIKISGSSPNLNPVRSLYRSRVAEDLERLEQLCYTSAEKYWKNDEWVPIDAILDGTGMNISEMDVALGGNSFLERRSSGYVYLVSVDRYVHQGESAPRENTSFLKVWNEICLGML